jgi:hypothetical protein
MANNVVIVVTADGSQAIDVAKQLEAAFEKTGHKIGEQTPHVTSLTDELGHMGPAGKVGSSAIEDLANVLTSRLGFASKGASAGIEELLGSLGGAGSSAGVAGAAIAALAGTALVATEVAKKSTEVFVSQAESVRHLSELTGSSAQQASVLSATMRDLGVDTDLAAVAFGRMSIAIQKGTLEKYGIDVKRSSDGSIDFNAVLKQVAAQFESNTNVTARNAEMTAIFGRGWQTLLPLLSQGAEGVQKLEDAAASHTLIFSKEDLDNAKQFEIAQRQLGDAVNNAWGQIGAQIAPALTTIAQDVTKVVDLFNSAKLSINGFFQPLAGLQQIMGPFGALLQPTIQAFQAWANTQPQVASSTNETTSAINAQTDALTKNTFTLQDATNAARQYAQDQLSAAQADARVSDVQTQWAQKVADAEARKANDIKNAQAGVAAAQQNLVTVEEQSAQSIVSAKDRVRQAEEKLRQDSQVDVQSARTVADAKLNLARVEQDIASGRLTGVDATRAYEDATTNLSRTQDDAATKEAKRQQQIADDQAAVTKAKQDETRAEVQAARDIANARTQITNAVTALNKAEHEVTITVADRTRHELELRSALLSQSLAHERVTTDIRTMTQMVYEHAGAWKAVMDELTYLHVTSFPNIISDLHTVKSAADAAASSVPTYSGDDSAARRDSQRTPAFVGGVGGGNFTTNVTINGVIADKNAANTIGAAVADGVHKQFLRWQNSGQSLGFGSKH